MASYQSANFNLKAQSIAGRKEWQYEDTGPVSDVSEAAGFIADAKAKGAEAGDFVTYIDTSRKLAYGMTFYTLQDTGATTGTLGLSVLIGDTS